MMNGLEDQAAGLRRLFRTAPPEVLTVLPCGGAAMHWLAQQLVLRVRGGVRVLAMDESVASGNLADCLGVSLRFDLLQAAEGHVAAQHCLAEPTPGLQLASVARLARAVGSDRVTNQRVVSQFRQLQADFAEWMVVARPADLGDLSPLALAAPRLLLVATPNPLSVTEAYAALKRLAPGADTLSIALACAGADDQGGGALLANLQAVARHQLGLTVERVSSVGESLALGGVPQTRIGADTFIERLIRRATVAQRGTALRRVGA